MVSSNIKAIIKEDINKVQESLEQVQAYMKKLLPTLKYWK